MPQPCSAVAGRVTASSANGIRDLYPGKRTIFFGAMPKGKLAAFGDAAFVKDFSPCVGHQVVKVAPGGTSYEIFTLDAADESMRVLAKTGNN